MRLFIALPLPVSARRALFEAQQALQRGGVTGRFVPIENFHITLRFLGERPESDLPALVAAMRNAVCDARPFGLSLGAYGSFSRTGYIEAEGNLAELTRLNETLEAALLDAGMGRARERFLPHITLGRNLAFPAEAEAFPAPSCRRERFPADTLVLYESRFEAGGMRYMPVHKERFS